MADDEASGEGGKARHYFALPKGTKIFEFEIVSVLGHGGFGITYKAADTDFQRTVAIKEFFPSDFAGRLSDVSVHAKSDAHERDFQDGLRSFLEEARLIARFQHPNIVGVERFFEAHGTGYIVFTYETGQTLSQHLAAGPLSEAELRQMLAGVLDGLEVVHEAAILHRDLKPNNIMLRGDGAAVLIDFGAARDFQHRHSRTVTAIASAGYAPPEQYGVGGQQGPWSDFYALGAIAYRCVTGLTPTDSLRRLRNDPLKPTVEAARGKYDTGLLRTIDWMLRVEEADRPASVAEVRAALAGGAIRERKGGGRETSIVQERPRRRGLAWLTAASVLALASAGAVAGVMLRNDPEQVKAFACAQVGLWCDDRLASLPAEKEATGASSLPASQPQGSAVHPDPASVTAHVPTLPSVASAPMPVPRVGSPPAIAAPQSPEPAADSQRGSNSPAALLSPPASASSAGAPAPSPEAASKPPPGPALSAAAEVWATTKDTTSIPVLETFVARYKDTFFAEMARTRIEELKKQQVAANMPPAPAPDETAWAKIKDSEDPEQVRAFLKLFPTSMRQPDAKALLAALVSKIEDCEKVWALPEEPGKGSQKRCLKPGNGLAEWFKDCPNCPEMVVVPAGHFTMGSTEGEGRDVIEGPPHEVTISKPFAVGRFTVTRGEFANFVREARYASGDSCLSYGGTTAGKSFRSPGFAQDDRHPVVCVNWDDAKAFAVWLSKDTGKPYRLLSEAEREYVTRAGTTSRYWWGSSVSTAQANYAGPKGEYRQHTVTVDSFRPNPWGLYNVHGNVWDWVEDCWHKDYHGAPTDGSAWSGCSNAREKVVRGGSWFYAAHNTSAYRIRYNADQRIIDVGFRLARTLSPLQAQKRSCFTFNGRQVCE